MSDECLAFERALAGTDREARTALADHAMACPSCREQAVADRSLRALLAGVPRPELPPFFAQQCASRAPLAPSARPLGARDKAILRAYWVLTLVVGATVLARIEWSMATSPILAAWAAMAVATTLAPLLLLARLRGGLPALMRRMLG